MSVVPKPITAVVLAGGLGTRIKHLIGDLPKPMALVEGRPFLEWVVCYLAAQRIWRVIFSTGYRADMVENYFQSQPVAGVTISCSPEPEPLGTAGGFLHAIRNEPQQSTTWLVLNGDSLALARLAEMTQLVDAPGVNGAILGVRMTDAARYGTISHDDQGFLTGFNEKKPGAGVINAGVYLLESDVVALFPAKRPLSFETDVFPALIQRGIRLKVCVADAPFLDIGTPESLPQASSFIRQNQQFFNP